MSHVDQNPASDITMQSPDSLRAEAEQLRRQVGSENMNQSSVIASRRLDEALLRLDLATGRRRQTGSSITSTKVKIQQPQSPPRRPLSVHSAPASDLELDESIAQSSSVWLEPTEEPSTRYRLDAAPTQGSVPQSHLKPSPKTEPTQNAGPTQHVEPEPIVDHTPAFKPAESTTPQATQIPPSPSIGSFADLFTAPIDVMLSTETDRQQASDTQQFVTSVPEAKWRQSAVSPEDAVKRKPNQSETSHEREVYRQPEAATESEVVKESIAAERPSVIQEAVPKEVHAEEPIVESPSTAAHEQLQPFQATWQVDEFVVPSTVDELFLAGSIAEQLAARLAAARTDGLHTIAVTSPKSGEGRSTVAMGMALSVAFSGLRVALVDADPKGVKLATDLQLDLENSWIDAIRTDLPLEEAAVFSQADSLTLIPLLEHDSDLPLNPSELRRLLQQLKESFDLVIVDCGASAVSEVALCDTALIVRDVHRTKALEVETLAMSLRRNGLQGIGVVENFCPQ